MDTNNDKELGDMRANYFPTVSREGRTGARIQWQLECESYGRKSSGRWGEATGASGKERAAADGARGQGRRVLKEQRPLGRGDRDSGDRKSSGRWGEARGAAQTARSAADGAG